MTYEEPRSIFGLMMVECDKQFEERREEKRRSWGEFVIELSLESLESALAVEVRA